MTPPRALTPPSIDARGVPAYPLPEGELELTLRQLRWLAIAAPIVVVLLLESVRLTTIGVTSLKSRLLLDGLVAVALFVMSGLMVRSIGRMQGSLRRHNEELLALHGAGLDVSAELSLDAVLNKVVADRTLSLPRLLLLQVAIPSEIPGYVLGSLKFSPAKYLAAVAMVELPFALGAVYLGDRFLERDYILLAGVALAGLAATFAAGWFVHRHRPLDDQPMLERSPS